MRRDFQIASDNNWGITLVHHRFHNFCHTIFERPVQYYNIIIYEMSFHLYVLNRIYIFIII